MIDHIYVVWHREEVRKVMEENLVGVDKPITYIGPDPNGQDPDFPKWLHDNNYKAMEDWKIGKKSDFQGDYWGRDIKNGELACTINHLNAWKQAKIDNSQCALILEQDSYIIRDGEPTKQPRPTRQSDGMMAYSVGELRDTINQTIDNYVTSMEDIDWDMLYLGQCGTTLSEDTEIEGIQKTIWTYCTGAYILRPKGIDIVLNTNIEQNLVAVDEYLPALYAPAGLDKIHPNLKYLNGRLKAYNIARVNGHSLVKQAQGHLKLGKDKDHSGGVSDTENSPLHIPYKPKKIKMKAIVLNLKHRKDRKEAISQKLDKEGIEYSIFHGLYWKDPNFKTILKLNNMKVYEDWKIDVDNTWYNRGVLMGEAAVAASYCLLFKDLKNNIEPVLILQDDATWKEGTLKKWIEMIESNDMSDIDAVYLCGNPVNYKWNGGKTGDIIEGMNAFEEPLYSYDAHAIVYYPSGIEKIMNSGLEKKLMSFDEYLMILYGRSERPEKVENDYENKLNIIKVIGSHIHCFQTEGNNREPRTDSDIIKSEVYNGNT